MEKLENIIQEMLKTLEEAPLGNFSLEGDWRKKDKAGGNFDKQSVGILTSPVAEKKFRNFFVGSDYDINVYFLKMKNSREFMELGKVDEEFVNEKLGWTEYQHDEDALNVIFTKNIGAERMPMTPWTAAHRIGHAIQATSRRAGSNSSIPHLYANFSQYFVDFVNAYFESYGLQPKATYRRFVKFGYPDKLVSRLLGKIGSFRSARMDKIARPLEFTHEMFAQYLNTGEVKFNETPEDFQYDRMTYRFKKDEFEEYFSAGNFSRTFDYHFDSFVGASIGDILVM